MPFGLGKKSEPVAPVRRSLAELAVPHDAWGTIQAWMAAAARPVEILPVEQGEGEQTLVALQVPTHTTLGTVAYRTGGILLDHGWIRILGAGHPRIGGGLRYWNESLGGDPLDPPVEKALIVAYDALGGLFALNGGKWPGDPGLAHYFTPDTRKWEPMGLGYSEFVEWAMSERLDMFYEGLRWSGWEDEIGRVGPDQAISVYPPIGFHGEDGAKIPIAERDRRPIPAREVWTFSNELASRLAGTPAGQKVGFNVTD